MKEFSKSQEFISKLDVYYDLWVLFSEGSGFGKLYNPSFSETYTTARKFANFTNCNGDNWIDCLRGKSLNDLLAVQSEAPIWASDAKPDYVAQTFVFRPTYGDEFMPKSVTNAIKSGDFRKNISIMIGHNEMESSFFVIFQQNFDKQKRYVPILPSALIPNVDSVKNDIRNNFIQNDTIGISIAEKYTSGFSNGLFGLPLNSINPIRRSAMFAASDYAYACPTVLFGGWFAKNSVNSNGKVYQYRFTYSTTQSISNSSIWGNSTHTDEYALVFGQPFKPLENLFWLNSDRYLSKVMMDIWTYFATHK